MMRKTNTMFFKRLLLPAPSSCLRNSVQVLSLRGVASGISDLSNV
eukprot:CAMPEP_0194040596 /NCGR_PEP_ID=MMETSP0009_2-20130614/12564_1 /TAXON_ID=210454 /ORGANISM="Grammatophora oceanica, Strain CCMP 410" /LENGTH=44 /DNA_ID= /DNA_START= /DNA_END= /DNA_ORIENTATION=